ncbi:glycosyl transferase [Cellulophaga sp. 20_2_10]|uniref:glycosyltransferase family 32 protein n=1 Tax=Cellulophaga sp. 20_2_10 TaxID=2942476 RepID=UPI00201A2644|nr:glycosyltransferase [Cellulophaga sp. 20_2_10]MCL5244782.1 glycosyl transferase [Cellulophaga sp. 20_2_10]
MIPKVIHYCWFGRGKMPRLAEICIASWKKYLPEYELYLWNEDSFDVNSCQFTKEAYEAKKYAFVTDYVRLYALKHHGGVYMDTDVEVLKNLDRFLKYPAFSGFEDEINIPTGIMASVKDGKWVNYLISYYDNKPFKLENGTLDTLTNTFIIGDMTKKLGFIPNNKYQCIDNELHLFPKDYFCPKSQVTGKIEATENTYCIHHFSGSWMPMKKKRMTAIKKWLMRIIGVKNVEFLIKILNLKALKKHI